MLTHRFILLLQSSPIFTPYHINLFIIFLLTYFFSYLFSLSLILYIHFFPSFYVKFFIQILYFLMAYLLQLLCIIPLSLIQLLHIQIHDRLQYYCLINKIMTSYGAAPFFGFMGVSMALVLANFGAAYGTAKAGTGISSISIWKPAVVMKSLIPVVMAGILGIYGMIVAVIISQKVKRAQGAYTQYQGYAHMASGLVCGFSCISAGYSIGKVGEVGIRCNALQERLFVGMILILIFGEALALYGLIVSLILSSAS